MDRKEEFKTKVLELMDDYLAEMEHQGHRLEKMILGGWIEDFGVYLTVEGGRLQG